VIVIYWRPSVLNEPRLLVMVVASALGAGIGISIRETFIPQRPYRAVIVVEYISVATIYFGAVGFLTWLRPYLLPFPAQFNCWVWQWDPYDAPTDLDCGAPDTWSADWLWQHVLFVLPVSLIIAQLTSALAFRALRGAAQDYRITRKEQFVQAVAAVALAVLLVLLIKATPLGQLTQLAVLVWAWRDARIERPVTLLEFVKIIVQRVRVWLSMGRTS
jgi:hypothetical protein